MPPTRALTQHKHASSSNHARRLGLCTQQLLLGKAGQAAHRERLSGMALRSSAALVQLGRLLGKPGQAESTEKQALEICLRQYAAWARPEPVQAKPQVHVPDLAPREQTPVSR